MSYDGMRFEMPRTAIDRNSLVAAAGKAATLKPTAAEIREAVMADPDFETAVNEAFDAGYTSVAHLQRTLVVGYTTATQLIDAMVKCRIIAPRTGPVPTQPLLITRDEWELLRP